MAFGLSLCLIGMASHFWIWGSFHMALSVIFVSKNQIFCVFSNGGGLSLWVPFLAPNVVNLVYTPTLHLASGFHVVLLPLT